VRFVPTYETIFITLPTLSEDEERTVVAPLSQLIADRGTMAANERIGRRRLAYPIKKFEDGVYTRFLYDADPSLPKELERRLRISDKVLRQLTVRLEEDWAVAAKEQAVRDALAREEAEVARLAAEAAGVAAGPAGDAPVLGGERAPAVADEDDEETDPALDGEELGNDDRV
jgi:small subunit ribosomal protein S6